MSKITVADMHVHSDNSPDGYNSVTVLCEKAVAAGIRAIAITDHCECNLYTEKAYDKAALQSHFETIKAKSVFAGQLLVLSGVELGQPLQDREAEKSALQSSRYDFIITSLHNIAGRRDFYYLSFDTPEEAPGLLLQKYYEELLEQVTLCDFDTLAHLTYPLRYINGEKKLNIDIAKYAPLTDEILRTLAKRGKALEINTSGLAGSLRATMPSAEFVRRFKELGGEYITVGSDAHYGRDLGFGIAEGYKIARAAGFSSVYLYQKREPIAISIENIPNITSQSTAKGWS